MNENVPSPKQAAANNAYNRKGFTEAELRDNTKRFLKGLSLFVLAGIVACFCPEESSRKSQQKSEIRQPATRSSEDSQSSESITDDTDDQMPAPNVSVGATGGSQQASTELIGEKQATVQQQPLESE